MVMVHRCRRVGSELLFHLVALIRPIPFSFSTFFSQFPFSLPFSYLFEIAAVAGSTGKTVVVRVAPRDRKGGAVDRAGRVEEEEEEDEEVEGLFIL